MFELPAPIRPGPHTELKGLSSTGQKRSTRAHHGDEIPERDVTYHLMATYLPLNYDTPALTPVLRPKYL